MCIIIDRPADHRLTMQTLEDCARQNKEGWGIMYVENGRVQTHRGLLFEGFKAIYNALPSTLPMTIHFRWRTHGAIDLNNCHPYPILSLEEHGRDLWVMHNGVIQCDEWRKDMSDTWHWINDLVAPVLRDDPDLIGRRPFRKLLEETVNGSRLIFLDDLGNKNFLNRHSWSEDMGCYFSNEDYRWDWYETSKTSPVTPSILKKEWPQLTFGGQGNVPFLPSLSSSGGRSVTTSGRSLPGASSDRWGTGDADRYYEEEADERFTTSHGVELTDDEQAYVDQLADHEIEDLWRTEPELSARLALIGAGRY